MGRGDKRTAKGKRFKGSYGNSRPHRVKGIAIHLKKADAPKKEKEPKKEKTDKVEKAPAKKAAPKKTTKKKTEE